MLGAIAGDIIGSRFEGSKRHLLKPIFLFNKKCRFTDDTVLTVAIAEAILDKTPYVDSIRKYALRYPHAGYGKGFKEWMKGDGAPYNSYGNGSAMRVSPIGWAFNSVEKILEEAKKSAEITHNHPEGIKGAQAVALAIYLARKIKNKLLIKEELKKHFDYNFDMAVSDIPDGFDVTCQGTIPICFSVFFETDSFLSGVRTAIKLGGDADTNASIVGALAEAYYGDVPDCVLYGTLDRLRPDLFYVMQDFMDTYVDPALFTRIYKEASMEYRKQETGDIFGT